MSRYNEILGDIDYRDHYFDKWIDKVDWEVNAISIAIINLTMLIQERKK